MPVPRGLHDVRETDDIDVVCMHVSKARGVHHYNDCWLEEEAARWYG